MPNKKHSLKTPNIVGQLEQFFKRELGDINLAIKQSGDDREFYSLTGGASPFYFTDGESGHHLTLIPITVFKHQTNYWLALSIALKGTISDVSSVSISVYTGSRTEDKEKLFRAEWAQEESNNGHAQPHWHFHIKNESNWNESFEQQQVAVTFSATESIKKDNIKKIHFAMAAQWHLESQSHMIDLRKINSSQVISWICSAYQYIIHQLSYIEK